MDTSNRCKPY